MAPKRPTVGALFSTSSQSLEVQGKLAEAQSKIESLEQEAQALRDRLISPTQITRSTAKIAEILPRPYQSRQEKDPAFLAELTDSIRTFGFRGAIWVQILPDGSKRLVAGETRLLAATQAGLEEIPIDAIDCDDATAVKLSRIENSRRRGLNDLDDAEEIMYLLMLALGKDRAEVKRLLYQFKNAADGNSKISPEIASVIQSIFDEVAPELSIASFVTSRLPLLELPTDVMEAYRTGRIPYTAAIELGRVEDEELRQQLIDEVAEGLSVSKLKSKLRPKEGRSISGGLDKLRGQVEKIVPEKLSQQEREEVRDRLVELQTVLKQKLKEIQ